MLDLALKASEDHPLEKHEQRAEESDRPVALWAFWIFSWLQQCDYCCFPPHGNSTETVDGGRARNSTEMVDGGRSRNSTETVDGGRVRNSTEMVDGGRARNS